MKKTLQLLFALFLTFTVAACVTGGGQSGWGTATGVVTNDPNSIPNIAWQTDRQRDVLMQQSSSFGKEQQEAFRDPNRPSLQRIEGAAPAAAPLRKVNVAILLPLTGKNADLGQAMLKAAQMALFDVGSSNFDLVPKDTKSTPAGAAEAARSAAGADLILGPIFADDVKAVKPVVRAPVIAYTTDWSLAGGDTYIMGFLPFAQVARVAAFAQSKGLDRFAVYAPQTEYCDVVISTLQRTGARITKVERYSPQQSDLSDLVKDFADRSRAADGSLEFNTLLLPVGGESLKSLVSILDLHGVTSENVKFAGTGLWDDASLTNDPALFGGWFAAPDPALRRDFEKRYSENYGAAPPRLASLAYDSTALAAVLARTGGDPYSRAQLTNPRGFAGIDGIFRFRPDGLAERGLAILEIQSGRARVIDPAPTAFISGSGS